MICVISMTNPKRIRNPHQFVFPYAGRHLYIVMTSPKNGVLTNAFDTDDLVHHRAVDADSIMHWWCDRCHRNSIHL